MSIPLYIQYHFIPLYYLVIVQTTDRDGREYQLGFPIRALHTDERTSLLMVFSRLSQSHNSVGLFLDCMDMGIDQTEISLRRIFANDMIVVSSMPFCDMIVESCNAFLTISAGALMMKTNQAFLRWGERVTSAMFGVY